MTDIDAKEIFCEALDRPSPEDRSRYLEQACGTDRALQGRVSELLRAHQDAGRFLGGAGSADDEEDPPATERPGTIIGPYKLLEQIGEGGMGTVYMAEQTQPVRRHVALKVIKPGMDSRRVMARFDAERQALALMDHPNIARVLDAGTTGDRSRPYFVMELVKGVPITTYCDQRGLPPRERLELFIEVCQAVQHAHQKGVIHRDLKPNNVLVARYDEKPVPKVIDFGVAKAVGGQLTERTMFTGYGQLVGTLEYMSPEQACFNALDVDTRSDIYSLGVLLYELLTGVTPFDRRRLRESALDETLRMIREEEPPKPSTQVSRMRSEDGALHSTFHIPNRQELDWIVMKALEKDRNRRYETASALALDVGRYLADEPVQACPPSPAYRLRKFVHRNQVPVLAAALVLLALVGGIIGTTWGMLRAERAQGAEAMRAEGEQRAKEEALRRSAQVEKGTEILAAVFQDFDPQAAEREGVLFRVLLARRLSDAAHQLEGEAVGDPLVTARLQHVLGVSLRELGHGEQARRLLVEASQTRQRLLGSDHLDTAASKHYLAMAYRDDGEHALAETLYQEALAVRMAQLGAEHADTLLTQHYLALLYQAQGRHDLAETLFKQVLTVRMARLGADHPDTLTTQHRLAHVFKLQGKSDLAETLWKEVLSLRKARLGDDHLDTVATEGSLAGLYHARGNFDLAETMYKEVLAVRTAKLGADHPDTLGTRAYLASLYLWQNNYPLAEAQIKEVLTVRTAKLGADHPDTLASQHELARLYHWQGNDTLAAATCEEVLTAGAAKLGHDHQVIHGTRHTLANVYRSLKKLDQSIPLLEDTLRIQKAKYDPNHPGTLGMEIDLGLHYCDAERFADAAVLVEEVLQPGRKEAVSDTSNFFLIQLLVRLEQHYDATGKPDEAAKLRKVMESR